MATVELNLPNPEENRATLALFWETAQPLKHVVAELPDLGGGPKFQLQIERSALVPGATLVDVLNSASSAQAEMTFPNLPEPLFERLALRFRPFYANDEDVNLLRLLNFVARLNPHLHQWRDERKGAWERSVFWGAMGMPERSPPVKAEDVIKTGLYSRYFHVNKVHRDKTLEYEKSLGADMFRIALVSSVWQRSNVVVHVAAELQTTLVELGIISAEAVEAAKVPVAQPAEISLKLVGGPGALQVQALDP